MRATSASSRIKPLSIAFKASLAFSGSKDGFINGSHFGMTYLSVSHPLQQYLTATRPWGKILRLVGSHGQLRRPPRRTVYFKPALICR
ncbi:hypothetical protein HOLleu_37816 [Holothuria leucospilota]|uniref:Uncharacterized protein n=1 Tax=Holothuria leucospilota TaxID=206669 RepID=A0A9Q0YPI1_HOLLE|nr:hypothetical protein HOLleu_37816 [Holothuria leucospilota]